MLVISKMIQTITVEIPDGYKLEYNIVKVKTESKMGRPILNQENDPKGDTWNSRNRKKIQDYNREYYQRKKAERIALKEAEKQKFVKKITTRRG